MRDAFVDTLFRHAKNDPSIILMTGDLGYGVLDKFSQSLPEQFINAGVAEQSMVSMAAGLASTGKLVFVYSIANFPTIRCLEQIRNDVCAMNTSVVIVSVGAGYSYGSHGYSHHAVEDLGIMRALPNIQIHSPGDPLEAIFATDRLCTTRKPAYLRLGKNGENNFDESLGEFNYAKPREIRDGQDGCIVFTGSIGEEVLTANEILNSLNIFPKIYSIPNFDSVDRVFLHDLAKSKFILTVEENVLVGGFGMLVVEKLMSYNLLSHVRIQTVGAERKDIHVIGNQEYLRSINGLSAIAISNAFTSLMKPEE